MRKTLSITSAFILFTLVLTHGAIAQGKWKENTVTNELPVTIYITFATWRPASGDVPTEGYRTEGYVPIPSGDSRTFYAWDDKSIFFRFQRLDEHYISVTEGSVGYQSSVNGSLTYLSPAAGTPTVSSWMMGNEWEEKTTIFGDMISVLIKDFESLTFKSFNIVTPTGLVFGAAGLEGIKFTDVPQELLQERDGFIKYRNGSHITVTREWWFRWDKYIEGHSAGDPVIKFGEFARADYALSDLGGDMGDDANGHSDDLFGDLDGLGLTDDANGHSGDLFGDLDGFGLTDDANGDGDDVLLDLDGLTDDDMAGDSDGTPDEGLLDLPVNIPDPELRSTIASALGKDVNAPISRKEMQTLTELVGFGAGLTGLEFATNLRVLRIWGSTGTAISVTDILPLKNLVNLKQLELYGDISDVSPLKDLVNLESLNLSHNTISDVSPLKDLVNLYTLELAFNTISDISPLKDLINLEWLQLADNYTISDVSPLKDLINLEWLYLSRNTISDVSPLKDLVSLGWLDLDGNTISDVSPLKDLVNLESLNLSRNNISSVLPLKDLADLESLNLSRNTISDVSPLKDLVSLGWLDLDGNTITDVSPLKDLVNLESLNLSRNNVSGVLPLKDLVNLKELYLAYNTIADVSPLKDLENLESLDLSVNNISNVSPLRNMVNLEKLNIQNNPVFNAHTLSHLTGDIALGEVTYQCGTLMPDTFEPLDRVRVYRDYAETEVSGGRGFWEIQERTGSVKAAVVGDADRHNRTWTIQDTVADDKASLTLTVKFLSPTEAHKLTLADHINPKALVDPPPWMMADIRKAARDWATSSNMTWKFIKPGKSGKSDIRIAFLDPNIQPGNWESTIGSPSDYQKESYDNSATMYLSTDAEYGTLLHEFGHALGLTHEHLSPQFRKIFDWDHTDPDDIYDTDPENIIYKKIASNFSGYSPDTIKKGDKQARQIDRNYLDVRDIDEKYSEFDNTSVMTYTLPAELLKTVPGAPDWAKALVDEEWAKENKLPYPIGIGRQKVKDEEGVTRIVGFEELSDRDRKFIADVYGQPIPKARVWGQVDIDGREYDWDPSFGGFLGVGDLFKASYTKPKDTREIISPVVIADAGEYVKLLAPIKFHWDYEMRVEVHLHTKKVDFRSGYVEVAATVLLFHSEHRDTENIRDLDSYNCSEFRIPLGGSEEVKLKVQNNFPLFVQQRRWCGGLKLDKDTSGLTGDLLALVNGHNWAEVTLKFRATTVGTGTPVSAAAAPAAASMANTSDPRHDVNGDGEIDAADLLLVSQYFGRVPPMTPPVDVNNDNTVTVADLVQVARYLHLSRVPAAPTRDMPLGLTYRTVQGWIDTARLESDGSRVFQMGIANLEALLLLIVPEETVLLANYPNPFNPETWIPYHLAKPADVTLTIYAIDGKVVRHLDLGHQAAGYYQSKSRAAYWDGRNDVGERVASGIYFYTLTAGEFAATRKMLILK